jgi:hypothetical protein
VAVHFGSGLAEAIFTVSQELDESMVAQELELLADFFAYLETLKIYNW